MIRTTPRVFNEVGGKLLKMPDGGLNMIRKIAVVAAGLAYAVLMGCADHASPAPEHKANVASTNEPTRVPLAATPDGTAANTGNLANGQQSQAGKK